MEKIKQMNITSFYSHTRMMRDARKGMAIINATPRGNEGQRYNVGDVVKSTNSCTYRFMRGVIVEAYTANGYCYYVCQHSNGTYTVRQKDIELI